MKNIIAVDVGKHSLEVFLDSSNEEISIRNLDFEIEEFVQGLSRDNDWVVFEYTGGYEKKLIKFLALHQIPFSVCSGAKIRYFAISQSINAKTDKIDAKVIAKFASVTKPEFFKLKDKKIQDFRELLSHRSRILVSITAYQNTLEIEKSSSIVTSTKKILNCFQSELEQVEYEIEKLLLSSAELKTKFEKLKSIPGVGKIVALTMISELPELGTLTKSKAAGIAGLAPMNRDSGCYFGKRKMGFARGKIKQMLFMPTIASLRVNTKIRTFYEKLKKQGKPSKVAIGACMRKLVIMMNAILREKKDFDSEHISLPSD